MSELVCAQFFIASRATSQLAVIAGLTRNPRLDSKGVGSSEVDRGSSPR